jgi:hypothetical protein
MEIEQHSSQVEEYLAAALPAPVTLLHQRLKPFSLGHRMLLLRKRSPFLLGDRHPTLDDLLLGVIVCAHDYDQAQAELLKPHEEFNVDITRWLQLCEKHDPGFDPAPIVLAFYDYLIDGSKRPQFKKVGRRRKGIEPGAPKVAQLLATLIGKLHFTRTEALNCPYGLAQWLYLTYWEGEGRIVIEDAHFQHSILEFAAKEGLQLIRKQQSQISDPKSQSAANDGGTNAS